MENKEYRLIVGRLEEDWKDHKYKYQGHTEFIYDLAMPSVEVTHKVAELCGVKVYMIVKPDDTFGREPIFASPEFSEWERGQKEKRDRHNTEQQERIKRINASPKQYLIKKYINSKIVAERSEAIFEPTYSSQIRGGELSMTILTDKNKKITDLYQREYKSQSGSISPIRFTKRNAYYMREYPELFEAIKQDLKEIDLKFEETKKLISRIK
jgi:hypothetical protein